MVFSSDLHILCIAVAETDPTMTSLLTDKTLPKFHGGYLHARKTDV